MSQYCPFDNSACITHGFECPFASEIGCSTTHEIYGAGFDPGDLYSAPVVPQVWIERRKKRHSLRKIRFTIEDLQALPYEDYLQTPHWRNVAKRARKRAVYTCEICGTKPGRGRLHVHHKTYANRGRESSEDLQVVCDICHKKIHQGKAE
jgi:hypothetical protein